MDDVRINQMLDKIKDFWLSLTLDEKYIIACMVAMAALGVFIWVMLG